MPRPRLKRLARPRLVALVLAGAGLVALSACDLGEDADVERGRALFTQQCGTCHTLAEAGTSTKIGPDLDSAFADARRVGNDADTIEGIVEAQVRNPRPPRVDEDDPLFGRTFMPDAEELGLSDQDIADISEYVASVAGVPGIEPPQLSPPELFTDTCGACHILRAAGTTGTTGPDLDEVLGGQSAEQIRESIIDPNAELTPGFDEGQMPTNFSEIISKKDLAKLVAFLRRRAGG